MINSKCNNDFHHQARSTRLVVKKTLCFGIQLIPLIFNNI